MIVSLPDGTVVQATGIRRGSDPDPSRGLYLDAAWDPAWPCERIDWPDFGAPADVDAAHGAIKRALEAARQGERVEIGCLGGLGRTGTVLACMAVLAGVPSDDAVEWVRRNYRAGAVETHAQERFVQAFAARAGKL